MFGADPSGDAQTCLSHPVTAETSGSNGLPPRPHSRCAVRSERQAHMADTVSEVMTENPATIDDNQSVQQAARLMREHDTGAIIVLSGGTVSGIITDRDIAVRCVAEDADISAPVSQFCSTGDVTTVSPDTSLDQAVQLMRGNAIRRLPVVEGNRAVGIISIGDLAMERDSTSALADISAAAPNN